MPLENRLEMRKSKPVLIAAGLIWVLVALAWAGTGQTHRAEDAILHGLTEYVELFLFLLPAMTYINALEERDVFQWLRVFLVSRGYSLRRIFWTTGTLAFLLSPIADNLTTALLLGAVVVAVGGDNRKFIHFGLYQRRRGGECRWRLLAVRRHYHPDGLAEREGWRFSSSS